MKKIMIIAAHMDDEVLGCGGIIAKHKENKDKVWVLFVAHRAYGHRFDAGLNAIEKKHALAAKKILGYDEAIFLDLNDERLDASIQDMIIPLEKLVGKIRPQEVYLPFNGDNNQDHRAVFDAARVVLRTYAVPFVDSVYMYEVPSSTEQSPPLPENTFMPNYYADISGHIQTKIKAWCRYKTEKRQYPHPRSEKGLKILSQKRGAEAGFKYAEAFVILRKKWI